MPSASYVRNPKVTFECWGTIATKENNLRGADESRAFIDALRCSANVVLHGVVPTAQLVADYSRMDAFLTAYNLAKNPSRGINAHRIKEFLASGRVIVSSNLTAYSSRPDLVRMVSERQSNRALPELFRAVLDDPPSQNADALVRTRKTFARDNTYSRQLDRIDAILEQVRPR